ncbi:MAG TPA: ATPase, T2SS/T4P/T4SS family [Patescibacteria group bacterium]|nr:ATPase, T2SS/T4P/T4SS family [Patescibacteria group bacterium]
MSLPEPYPMQCFNCLSEFDAAEAIWCSCNPQRPTKVCPFCMGCFCASSEEYKQDFWRDAPATLRDEIETLSQSRMLIGEVLVRSGIISTEDLLNALNKQKVDGRRLGEILVESGALPADRLERFLQSQHTATAIDVHRARVDAMMIRRLGVEQCITDRILPLEAEAFRDRHIMTLAMADPSDATALQRVSKATGYQVIPGVAPAESIVAVIRSIFPPGTEMPEEPVRPIARFDSASSSSGWIVARAISRRASHFQISRHNSRTQVAYRIDGVLYHDRASAQGDPEAALEEIRELSGLDGSKAPGVSTGRLEVCVEGIDYQLLVRLTRSPGLMELSVKIVDPITFPPRLDDLGLAELAIERLRMAIDKGTGLVVISAPPFSGASSTFYSLVMELTSQGRPLALLESPRAVSLNDITQEEFFPDVPDSFGESLARVTTGKTSAIAITSTSPFVWPPRTADLSGRVLVIFKIESRSLPDALLRLISAGFPASEIGRLATLVLHQRLVRRVCQACRTEVSNVQDLAATLKLSAAEATQLRVWRGKGCDECSATPGFRGRVPLVQTMRPNAAVADALARGSSDALLDACRGAGMTSLRQEALGALAAGLTTPEEITRK